MPFPPPRKSLPDPLPLKVGHEKDSCEICGYKAKNTARIDGEMISVCRECFMIVDDQWGAKKTKK